MKSLTNHSDLWAMASGGDQQAYAVLHKAMYAGLYNYLLHIVKDEDLADDLLQELFVKLWEKRSHIGTIKNVKAYFFTAARSMAINHFRKIKSQNLRLENFIQPDMEFSAEDLIVSAEEDIEVRAVMVQALNLLPARQREVVYLKFYENMDYKKITEVTGIRYQSVLNHVFRALQILRAEFNHQKMEGACII